MHVNRRYIKLNTIAHNYLCQTAFARFKMQTICMASTPIEAVCMDQFVSPARHMPTTCVGAHAHEHR